MILIADTLRCAASRLRRDYAAKAQTIPSPPRLDDGHRHRPSAVFYRRVAMAAVSGKNTAPQIGGDGQSLPSIPHRQQRAGE